MYARHPSFLLLKITIPSRDAGATQRFTAQNIGFRPSKFYRPQFICAHCKFSNLNLAITANFYGFDLTEHSRFNFLQENWLRWVWRPSDLKPPVILSPIRQQPIWGCFELTEMELGEQ